MIVLLQRVFAIVGGLVLAWVITIVGAEILRFLLASAFAGVRWPAWFPTTPIVLMTLILCFLIARAIWRFRPIRGEQPR